MLNKIFGKFFFSKLKKNWKCVKFRMNFYELYVFLINQPNTIV